MMRFQIRTLQVPTKGSGAFMPMLTSQASAATNGQNVVVGNPGTVRVPSPRPPALSDGELGGPFNQPSSVAPDWFLPSIYINRANSTLRFPGKLLSDNVLPVPAVNMGRKIVNWQHKTRVGGRTTTANPRPFTQWPTYGGGYN